MFVAGARPTQSAGSTIRVAISATGSNECDDGWPKGCAGVGAVADEQPGSTACGAATEAKDRTKCSHVVSDVEGCIDRDAREVRQ